MNKRRKVGLGVLATALAIGVMAPVEAHAERGGTITRAITQAPKADTNFSPKITIKTYQTMKLALDANGTKTTMYVAAGSKDLLHSVITITDREDGGIADDAPNVTYDWGDKKIDFERPGDYNLKLSVKDNDGNTTSHDVLFKVVAPELMPTSAGTRVIVGDKDMGPKPQTPPTQQGQQDEQKPEETPVIKGEKPVITLEKDLPNEVEYGAEFDLMKGVTAEDKEDGTLTDKITMEGKVDTKVPGDYKIVYNVEDKDGNKTALVREVKVKENPNPNSPEEKPVIGKAPVIEGANDLTLAVGQQFEPTKDVKATDEEDGDLTDKIKVDASKVDTSKVGDYVAEYTVEDKDGNVTKLERKIQVKELKDMGLPGSQGSGANGGGNLPQTGAVATGALGALGIAGGAGTVFFRKKR